MSGPIPYLDQIVTWAIQSRAAIPEIIATVEFFRDLFRRAGEPVPSGDELANMVDRIAAQNAAFNRSEIDRLKAKLAEQGA